MNVLVIGAGGREHALVWKLRQSRSVGRLYCLPGNAGTRAVAEGARVNPDRHGEIVDFCRAADIGLVAIGPEAPLADGLADTLRAAGVLTFGPSAAAAQLEASKSFTKGICVERGIPTACGKQFFNRSDARAWARDNGAPLVVKADGLAAGKGVTVCETLDDAYSAIEACFSGTFGESGASVLIEEKLEGEEASFFALCDGVRAIPFGSAQDYKRALDGDTGPNTGGMGAVSPAPMMTAALERRILAEIVTPTLEALVDRGTPFQGVLYAGLMMTAEGPKLIEYNVRFGDPECQVLMMRLKSDLLPFLVASARGNLSGMEVEWDERKAITVVMAAKGYPGSYRKGTPIGSLAAAERVPGVTVFHAGTALSPEGTLLASGGRVLNVTALGDTVAEARKNAYRAAAAIDWPDGFYRRDIGWRSLVREEAS